MNKRLFSFKAFSGNACLETIGHINFYLMILCIGLSPLYFSETVFYGFVKKSLSHINKFNAFTVRTVRLIYLLLRLFILKIVFDVSEFNELFGSVHEKQ
jgi:hypothetical protein